MSVSGLASPELNKNVHQGYFAEGMVAAIAAAAGLDVLWPRLGHGEDLTIYKPGLNGTSGSRQMVLQVKSWSSAALNEDGTFHYPLEVSAYNHLAGSDHDVRHYLVLCIVPSTTAQYCHSNYERVQLRQAAYWLSLREVDPEPTSNASSRTVRVPRTHLLTASTIASLLDHNEAGAVIA